MVTYGLVKHEDKSKTGIFIRGHANYAKKGADIVCAAVSTIGQVAALGVSKYDPQADVKHMTSGHISFTCKRTPETEAIVYTAIAGLDEVAKEYPENVRESV